MEVPYVRHLDKWQMDTLPCITSSTTWTCLQKHEWSQWGQWWRVWRFWRIWRWWDFSSQSTLSSDPQGNQAGNPAAGSQPKKRSRIPSAAKTGINLTRRFAVGGLVFIHLDFERLVASTLKWGPDAIYLQIGGNDLQTFRGRQATAPKDVSTKIKKLANFFLDRGVKVLLGGILPRILPREKA